MLRPAIVAERDGARFVILCPTCAERLHMHGLASEAEHVAAAEDLAPAALRPLTLNEGLTVDDVRREGFH